LVEAGNGLHTGDELLPVINHSGVDPVEALVDFPSRTAISVTVWTTPSSAN
jgi:hypothetical protein